MSIIDLNLTASDTYITHYTKKYLDRYKLILYKTPYADTLDRTKQPHSVAYENLRNIFRAEGGAR